MQLKGIIAISGILSTLVLAGSLIIFGSLNPEFHFLDDFISKLGAQGQVNAMGFNIFGFIIVGLLLAVFGFGYGRLLNDKLLSILLSLFGVGFAFTAIPVDMAMENSPVSKAHVVAICLGLGSWMFGLSRLGSNKSLEPNIRRRANFTAILLVLSIAGLILGLWSMPLTHRLVFIIVFGWTTISSLEILNKAR